MRQIVFSNRAAKKLEQILYYLEEECSEKAKQDFIKQIDKIFDNLKIYPEISEKSCLKEGLHRCIVTKHTCLYYQYDDYSIKVVTIFDSRMNPNKLLKELT